MELPIEFIHDESQACYRVVSGHLRLQAALRLHDELVLRSRDGTELLVMKTPDGRIIATKDRELVSLFVR